MTMEKILVGGDSPYCQVDTEVVDGFYRKVFNDRGHTWTPPPESTPIPIPPTEVMSQALTRTVMAEEIKKRLFISFHFIYLD